MKAAKFAIIALLSNYSAEAIRLDQLLADAPVVNDQVNKTFHGSVYKPNKVSKESQEQN